MFRYKSHKQAFIMTALVILLCLVCLTGATLALFTSDPNDGTIGIITTSGDVEVDIVDTAGNTLQNKSLAFITASDQAINSENALFEPGAAFITQSFRIKNTGDVTINFKLSIGKDDVVEIIGGKQQPVNLDEFFRTFDIWIVEEGKEPVKMKEFEVNGLKAKDSSGTYHLLIKMNESVGNEFQGKTYTGIGVTVYAVQGNAELN